MPKQKDSFFCNWIVGANVEVHERTVLYEGSISQDSNIKYLFTAHQNDDPKEKVQFERKARKTMFRAFLAAIYNCLEELTILKRFCRRSEDPSWTAPVEYKTIEQLYNHPDESYYIHKLDDMQKSLKDICILFSILSNSYQEIEKGEMFTGLEKSVDILTLHIQDEFLLVDELSYMRNYKEYLKLAIIKESIESKEQLMYISDEAYSSKLIYEDVLAFECCQYSYNSDWETARVQQKCWSVWKETQASQGSINKCREDTTNEDRVHKEIRKYCSEYIRDLYNQIDEWQNKYETELEKNDSKLIELKNEYELLILKYADLKVLYEKRNKEMEEWIEYRTKKKIADDYNKKLEIAAIKIQAWWRGQMFRRHLGPYSKKKGKKGKKGKGASQKGRKKGAKAAK